VAAIKARKPAAASNPEYEEAMRRLEDSDVSDQDENQRVQPRDSRLARELVVKPVERPSPKRPTQRTGASDLVSIGPRIKAERASPGHSSARPARTNAGRSARHASSPFVIPEGSQVVSLLSSSPEPEVEEYYAEDSLDETYEDPDLPSGPGWVKKARPRRGEGKKPPPPPEVPDAQPLKAGTASQAKQNGALNSLLRAKSKVMSKIF
jgi:hypothetical protein